MKKILFAILVLLNCFMACQAQDKQVVQGNYTYQTKEMPFTLNGDNIYGVVYIPENISEKMPLVIFSHGFSGTNMSGVAYARSLASQGYAVYAFDFRGGSNRSKSDGKTTEMSIFTEKADLEGVLNMVKGWDFIDSNNIFLLGSSQGGLVSAMVASDYPVLIKGLILLYPAFVIPSDAVKRYGTFDKVPETSTLMGMTIGRKYYEGVFGFDPYEYVKRYTKDVLIIHGTNDELVPLSFSEDAVKAYPSATLKIIEGGNHGFRGEHDIEATQYIVDYLKKHSGQ